MKDLFLAKMARGLFIQANHSLECLYEGQELLLDLYTLLVLVKGKECTEEDVRRAWLIAGLRWGPNPPNTFDLLDDDADPDDLFQFAQEDMIAVHNAAACLPEEFIHEFIDRQGFTSWSGKITDLTSRRRRKPRGQRNPEPPNE